MTSKMIPIPVAPAFLSFPLLLPFFRPGVDSTVGTAVGVSDSVGLRVGAADGVPVGRVDGVSVGQTVGTRVGANVGFCVAFVTGVVGKAGAAVTRVVGGALAFWARAAAARHTIAARGDVGRISRRLVLCAIQ